MSFMRVIRTLLVLCAIGALTCTFLLAQGGQNGAIRGTVADQTGAVVPGATITVKNQATGFERVVVSTETGTYVVPALEPGKYTVHCELKGFAKIEATD